jgi:antitoxin component of MazEF toxin-antitoxin module
MRARVQRRGDELVVVIPEEVAKEELIQENAEVEVRNPSLHPVFYMTLDEMLDRITPETLHGETDWGPDVGKEIVEY